MDLSRTPFDLSSTFVVIDDGPTALPVPLGPDFWELIRESPQGKSPKSRLISWGEQRSDWEHWEMHPASDEILFLMSGQLELILEQDGAEVAIVLESPRAFIMPRGVWHRARVQIPGMMLAITGGAGTEHRPISA